jgi:hypothetical protein
MEKTRGSYSSRASPCRSFVELRDHPLMQYRGMRNWPPVWTQAGTAGDKSARGELGVLKQVNGDRRSSQRFYLVIEHEGERYVGALLFDDAVFGWFISKVLRSHIGWPIKNISALDLSFSL